MVVPSKELLQSNEKFRFEDIGVYQATPDGSQGGDVVDLASNLVIATDGNGMGITADLQSALATAYELKHLGKTTSLDPFALLRIDDEYLVSEVNGSVVVVYWFKSEWDELGPLIVHYDTDMSRDIHTHTDSWLAKDIAGFTVFSDGGFWLLHNVDFMSQLPDWNLVRTVDAQVDLSAHSESDKDRDKNIRILLSQFTRLVNEIGIDGLKKSVDEAMNNLRAGINDKKMHVRDDATIVIGKVASVETRQVEETIDIL